MIDLEEAKQRVLSELEEAEEEDVPTLLNTIFPPSGHEEEARLIVDALEALVRDGLVLIAVANSEKDSWIILDKDRSLAEVGRLQTFIHFVAAKSYWDDRRDVGPPYNTFNTPRVVTTNEGNERAFEILDERGYQWWRQKSETPPAD
jgi:hypothetical protein